MSKDQLNAEEKEILNAYETGELKSLRDSKKRMTQYQQAAKYTLQKSKSINIRLPERDLQHLKAIAAEKGLPYQTLISSLLHQYTNKRKDQIREEV